MVHAIFICNKFIKKVPSSIFLRFFNNFYDFLKVWFSEVVASSRGVGSKGPAWSEESIFLLKRPNFWIIVILWTLTFKSEKKKLIRKSITEFFKTQVLEISICNTNFSNFLKSRVTQNPQKTLRFIIKLRFIFNLFWAVMKRYLFGKFHFIFWMFSYMVAFGRKSWKSLLKVI